MVHLIAKFASFALFIHENISGRSRGGFRDAMDPPFQAEPYLQNGDSKQLSNTRGPIVFFKLALLSCLYNQL